MVTEAPGHPEVWLALELHSHQGSTFRALLLILPWKESPGVIFRKDLKTSDTFAIEASLVLLQRKQREAGSNFRKFKNNEPRCSFAKRALTTLCLLFCLPGGENVLWTLFFFSLFIFFFSPHPHFFLPFPPFLLASLLPAKQ